MPGQNGTGPLGKGPQTGRGMGPCGGGVAKGTSQRTGAGWFGRGAGWFGRGAGRGASNRFFGRGAGRGFQFWRNQGSANGK